MACAARKRAALAAMQVLNTKAYSSSWSRTMNNRGISNHGHVLSETMRRPSSYFSSILKISAAPNLANVRVPKSGFITTRRAMSCCAGLGSPPPREIIVEYSEDDDYTDDFISLANAIEEAYPEFIVSGNPEELKPRKGAFEITCGDSILFSKLKTQRLPKLTEVLKAIESLPPPQCPL